MKRKPLRVGIVEDEPWARARLQAILADREDTLIVGEAGNADEARRLVAETAPDLLLLDINLPGEDAFALIASLGDDTPSVLFVTAHDEYALGAFDVQAIDYVLKPFEDERVLAALERARRRVPRMSGRRLADQVASLAAKLAPASEVADRLMVREGSKIIVVPFGEIAWIDAAGDTCRIHRTDGCEFVVRRSISTIESELDRRLFVRIHRSTIVGLRQIRELVMNEYGDYSALLDGGQRLSVSRSYRSLLEAAL